MIFHNKMIHVIHKGTDNPVPVSYIIDPDDTTARSPLHKSYVVGDAESIVLTYEQPKNEHLYRGINNGIIKLAHDLTWAITLRLRSMIYKSLVFTPAHISSAFIQEGVERTLRIVPDPVIYLDLYDVGDTERFKIQVFNQDRTKLGTSRVFVTWRSTIKDRGLYTGIKFSNPGMMEEILTSMLFRPTVTVQDGLSPKEIPARYTLTAAEFEHYVTTVAYHLYCKYHLEV